MYICQFQSPNSSDALFPTLVSIHPFHSSYPYSLGITSTSLSSTLISNMTQYNQLDNFFHKGKLLIFHGFFWTSFKLCLWRAIPFPNRISYWYFKCDQHCSNMDTIILMYYAYKEWSILTNLLFTIKDFIYIKSIPTTKICHIFLSFANLNIQISRPGWNHIFLFGVCDTKSQVWQFQAPFEASVPCDVVGHITKVD